MEIPYLTSPSPVDLAKKYFLEDVQGAVTPGTLLRTTLEAVAAGRPVNRARCAFLRKRGYMALNNFVSGQLDFEAFRTKANAEQTLRIGVSKVNHHAKPEQVQHLDTSKPLSALEIRLIAVREQATAMRDRVLAREAEQRPRLEEERRVLFERSRIKNAALFAEREKKEQRRRSARKLHDLYGQDFIEPTDYRNHMKPIMSAVHAGKPISEPDLAWLGTKGKQYWTKELREAHHGNIAEKLTKEWSQKGDPWIAVNASSQWRKAAQPKRALTISHDVLDTPRIPKCESALRTTRGGAMRDLKRFDEAKALGEKAHDLIPDDIRPCTLLGAVHIEMGEYGKGAKWYEKAESLGANRDEIDRELKSILDAAKPEDRKRLTAFLKMRGGFLRF